MIDPTRQKLDPTWFFRQNTSDGDGLPAQVIITDTDHPEPMGVDGCDW